MDKEDYSCLDLALYLNNCQAHYSLSDKYEELYPQEKGRWWLDKNEIIVGGQKIHLITYLGACWKLKGNDKDSLKHVWSLNGFKNAAGLIWLLEALGAGGEIIQSAYDAGAKAASEGGKQPEQSKAIKETVSWDEIKTLCKEKNICRLKR